MALFGLFGGTKKMKEVRCKKGRGNTYEIVGELYYQPNLLALTGGRKQEYGVKLDVQARLQPEHENPHDSNAVAVIIKKKKVGYMTCQISRALCALPIHMRPKRETPPHLGQCNGVMNLAEKCKKRGKGSI